MKTFRGSLPVKNIFERCAGICWATKEKGSIGLGYRIYIKTNYFDRLTQRVVELMQMLTWTVLTSMCLKIHQVYQKTQYRRAWMFLKPQLNGSILKDLTEV